MPSQVYSMFEQVRGWVSTSLLGLIAWVVIKGMALIVKNNLETKKLDIEDRKQEREGYGPLIQSMREELARVIAQHHACEERMNRIEGELAGYHRKALEQSIRGFSEIPPSSHAVDAARRVQEIIDKE